MRLTMISWIISLLAACTIALPAMAESLRPDQDLRDAPSIQAHLIKDYEQLIQEKAKQFDEVLGLSCAEVYQLTIADIYVLETIELNSDDAKPTKGTWYYRYDVARCDESKRYNLLMAVQEDGALVSVSLPPGDTLASPLLLNDSFMSAEAAALTSDANCKQVNIFDTKVIGTPDIAQGWEEEWNFLACGRSVDVRMQFTNDGNGGTNFAVKLKK